MQSIHIYALIPFLTLLQGIIFSILLWFRGVRAERYSDFWLSFALFQLSITGIPYMLGWLDISFLWEKLTYLPWDGFWFSIPPTIYLFLRSLTNHKWRFNWRKDLVYFIPYLVYFIEHLIVGLIGLGNPNFVKFWWNDLFFINTFYEVLTWVVYAYFGFQCFKLYKNYRIWVNNEFSDAEKVSFTWLRNFCYVYFASCAVSFLNYLYIKISGNAHNPVKYELMWVGYLTDTILMYYLSISGFAQARVRKVDFIAPIVNTDDNNKPKNALTEPDLLVWKQKILTYFETEKPFLNPELTLSELATTLKTNTSVLSQVINTGFDKNFNDFVNEYRVKTFQEQVILPQNKNLTLLAIAFDCGFNSKATFNRAYKKQTGKSPSGN